MTRDEFTATLDARFPPPNRPRDLPFLMPIDDVFSISGRGTTVTGTIEAGILQTGEDVEIIGLKDTVKVGVSGIEMFRKIMDEGRAGEAVGVFLRGITRDEVKRGQVLARPGSIQPRATFTAEVYLLTAAEGGLPASLATGDRMAFRFRTADVTGRVTLLPGVAVAAPGDSMAMVVTLDVPIAMDRGLRFTISEGGATRGIGVVADIMA